MQVTSDLGTYVWRQLFFLGALFTTMMFAPWSYAGEEEQQLTIVVMDPLAAPLSCPCVEGYAQRDYEQLADFIQQKTGMPSQVVFHESLVVALKKTKGAADLVIGKDSVVRSDAARAELDLRGVARLTGKDGMTSQTGLILVRSDDPAQNLADLKGYRFLFGPANSAEKHAAAKKLLTSAGVSLPEEIETSSACSDGACKIIEWGPDVRAATVISSYAKPLLEGCGTISKGDLRVVGETKPVPFVSAFVNRKLAKDVQQTLTKTLLLVRKDQQTRHALESLMGFVPIPAEEEMKATKAIETSATRPAVVIPPDDSWPGWRGRNRDGHSGWLPDRLPAEAHIVWREDLAGPGLAGIAATDQVVIIGDRDLLDRSDVFRCYAADDGELLWSVAYPAMGALDYGNTPRATPLIDGDRVYLHGAFGHLHCVVLDSGEILWEKQFQTDFGSTSDLPWGTCGSPIIADGKLIVNPGAPQASVVALDPESGDVLWRAEGAESAYGSFVVGELGKVMQVVGHDAESLGGWDLATGKRLWTLVPEASEDFSVPTPMVADGKLIVASENNGTRLFEFSDDGKIVPTPIAANEDLNPDTCTPVVVGSKVFGIWNELYCLDIEQGLKTAWTASDPSFRLYGSLLASGDRLMISGASGELLLLDAEAPEFKVLSRLEVFHTPNAELYSHPAMVGSRIYLRGENALVCVELDDSSASHE